MAALRFEASPDNKPEVTRLAHHAIEVTAHTWRTIVRTHIERDGSVQVSVTRDGVNELVFRLSAEDATRVVAVYTPSADEGE